MKKMLVVVALVLLMSAIAVPVTFAGTSGPAGNTTVVTVNGTNNFGVVGVVGKGNNTSLYYGWNSKNNLAVIGVVGCKNTTRVAFGSGARNNVVGVSVASRCR